MSSFALLVALLEVVAAVALVLYIRPRFRELSETRERIGDRQMRPSAERRLVAVCIAGAVVATAAVILLADGLVSSLLLAGAALLLLYGTVVLLALREARLAQQTER
jgi:uncharacterized membrane protein